MNGEFGVERPVRLGVAIFEETPSETIADFVKAFKFELSLPAHVGNLPDFSLESITHRYPD
jgi:hypothetical protein